MIHITMAVTTMIRYISVLMMVRVNNTVIVRTKRMKYIPGKIFDKFLERVGELTVKNGLDHNGREFGLQFRGLALRHCIEQRYELTWSGTSRTVGAVAISWKWLKKKERQER